MKREPHTLLVRRGGRSWRLPFEGAPLLSQVLALAGLSLPSPCGGRGSCGKCGVVIEGHVSSPNALEKQAGKRLSCQAVLLGDCRVVLPEERNMAQIQTEGSAAVSLLAPLPGRYGAAVDLGTTTVALRLYDLQSGTLLAESALLNPQAASGADVMSRIDAALRGELAKLSGLARDAVGRALKNACADADVDENEVESMVLAGNTTMLYLFAERMPDSLARAPFIADTLFDDWLTLRGHSVYLPPCMNAFVGADISCAALASGMTESPRTCLLVDVGTNGEIALWKDGRLHVASTAAGPAFEGAGISMGCGSIPGAIDRVWIENGGVRAATIDDAQALGICGSGLLDAVAVLLDLGLVDETGSMRAEQAAIRGGVALLPKDIRAVQLAKAAIAAGIKTLLHHAGVAPREVETLYLAGGFGSHLNIRRAVRIGMILPEFAGKTKVIGNASLDPAAMILLNRGRMAAVRSLAENSVHVALGGNARFNESFMEEMLFPEPE